MNIKQTLEKRGGSACELCSSASSLETLEVPPSDGSAEQSILACDVCCKQIKDPSTIDPQHWRCLKDSMWSPVAAVQVTAYRLLKKIAKEGWPQSLLDTLYLEPEVQAWAEIEADSNANVAPTKDSNGTAIEAGDSVTLIKDLDVKGAGFTAKRGTTVKNISLTDDPANIEGRVNGVRIVLKTCFLKKL